LGRAAAWVLAAGLTAVAASVWAAAAPTPPPGAKPALPPGAKPALPPAQAQGLGVTAAQVVERNVQARGGLEAWRRVQTMTWVGRAQGADPASVPLPFQLEMQRPNLTRFEISALNSRFVRIFDGQQGWKLRPGREGMPEAKAFSPEEVAFAREEFVIDGPLIDHAAKGITVQLEGADTLDGRKAYRLNLRLASGAARRLWVDAQTWLELRYDRPGSHPLSPGATVSTYFKDFASVEGLQVPMRIETGRTKGLEPAPVTDKLLLDRVVVNPPLSQTAFAKPAVPKQRRALVNIGGGVPGQPGQ
jgi:hypothetical protein